MYQLGGRYWEEFFPRTAQTLIDNQNADGSWPPDSRGSDRPFGTPIRRHLSYFRWDAESTLAHLSTMNFQCTKLSR